MGWKKFRRKLTRGVKAIATGGLSEVYEKNKNGIDRFLGKEDRRNARELAKQAETDRQFQRRMQEESLGIAKERRAEEAKFLAEERERYDSIYKPIEQRIGSELAEGPALEEQAAIAGGDFANSFDSSIQARERDQMRRGIDYRPGSSASRMQGENDAYNRARGIATAQTTARREEDDSHFLKSTAFFNAGGNSTRSRLHQGMQQMYGADYAATNTAGVQRGQNAALAQSQSAALNAQSYAGINTVANLVGQGVKMYAGAQGVPTGPTGLQSDPVSAVQPVGKQATGVTTHATSNPQATPIKNTLMNDYQTNQTKAAGAGAVQSEINQGFGRGS